MQDTSYNKKLGLALAEYANDPLGFVGFAFPWGSGELEGREPELWQLEYLRDIRDGLKTVDEVIQLATKSGHGVGKSALVSWLILWAISTMGDTRGVVTANTDTQLRTKTWPELGKWYRLFIAKRFFNFTATAIYSTDPEHEKTWRIDAIPWSEHNTEAFAGLHNKGRRIIVIFDEASAVHDRIWEVTEGALTDSETQIIWAVFGNPTRNTGRFRDCFHRLRHRWQGRTIDSRNVSFTNKDQIQKWIDDLGEDSDFVRVRVRGVEPNQSDNQFIPQNYVETARRRKYGLLEYDYAPVILTLDNAWTGGDEIIIGKRQGNTFTVLSALQKNDDDMQVAAILARHEDEQKADAVFIDFGYGTGVYSAGKQLGRKWTLIQFGGGPGDKGYLNKRAEMWGTMREWLRDGGQIPDDQKLCDDLVGPEGYEVMTGKNAGKIYLESKDDMKKRGIPSPNRADALALSFALPVKKRNRLLESIPKKNDPYDVLAMR